MQTIVDGDPLKFGLVARLLPAEIKLLRDVLFRVSGPSNSRRILASEILAQLREAGVDFPIQTPPDLDGALTFFTGETT